MSMGISLGGVDRGGLGGTGGKAIWGGQSIERGVGCKVAWLQAGIKPTALCSAFDKENSIEFPLDFVHYLYMKSNPNPSFYPTERVQKGIAHWDKQNNDVPAPNCVLKVRGEIIKVEDL